MPSQNTFLPLFPLDRPWSPAEAAPLACLLEASAPKAGNVHPQAAFADTNYMHFAASALAIAECFAKDERRVGRLVLDSVRAQRAMVQQNTILGTLLLLAPLKIAATQDASDLRESVKTTLRDLDADDCHRVYQAIRESKPGGMGTQNANDVAEEAPDDLLAAMQQVANFDAVARQYTNAFGDVFDRLLPWLDEELHRCKHLEDAICRIQVRWLAREWDGLIVRKAGDNTAQEVLQMAQETWDSICAANDDGRPLCSNPAYIRLDRFLRQDGNRRNPGTTADLIAAALFVRLVRI